MSLNSQPSGERLHIGIFGRTNVGKSSLMNALCSQELAIVSDLAGTTTDPVQKSMELLPLGPVVLIDTPGLDDETSLSTKRNERTAHALRRCDLAILLTDREIGLDPLEARWLEELQGRIPIMLVRSKADLRSSLPGETVILPNDSRFRAEVWVSTFDPASIEHLKEQIAASLRTKDQTRYLVRDLLTKGDLVILVTPIDSSAPKGRLILPQQQILRDVLDAGGISLVLQPDELEDALKRLGPALTPRMVITDSQAFEEVAAVVPDNLPLLSFSILFARYKGDLDGQSKAALEIDELSDGDLVLIAEGCTHHRQCEDIGTVKLPNWLRTYTGHEPQFNFYSGGEFPKDLDSYRLVIHCGACMLNTTEMQFRLRHSKAAGVPMTNYGTAIAHINGILGRCLDGLAALAASNNSRAEEGDKHEVN